jgi:hypothetical protein
VALDGTQYNIITRKGNPAAEINILTFDSFGIIDSIIIHLVLVKCKV